MGFTTFILLTGFELGQRDDFDPEDLAYIFSKSCFIWVFEAFCMKFVFYLLGQGGVSFFELLAYSGYKFVPLCLIVTFSTFGGQMAYWASLVVLSALFAIFMFKTFRRFSSGNSLADQMNAGSFNKKTFILVVSLLQVFWMWVLSLN